MRRWTAAAAYRVWSLASADVRRLLGRCGPAAAAPVTTGTEPRRRRQPVAAPLLATREVAARRPTPSRAPSTAPRRTGPRPSTSERSPASRPTRPRRRPTGSRRAARGRTATATTQAAEYARRPTGGRPGCGSAWSCRGRGLAGGARWFRCDLVETRPRSVPTARRCALRQPGRRARRADSPLLLRCHADQARRAQRVETMPTVPCDGKHNGEFVGVWTAPGNVPYPSKDRDCVPFYDGCRKPSRTYVGVPDDAGPAVPRPAWSRCSATRTSGRSATAACAATCGSRLRPLTGSLEGRRATRASRSKSADRS